MRNILKSVYPQGLQSNFASNINPFTPGGEKKVTHTLAVGLSICGLFELNGRVKQF